MCELLHIYIAISEAVKTKTICQHELFFFTYKSLHTYMLPSFAGRCSIFVHHPCASFGAESQRKEGKARILGRPKLWFRLRPFSLSLAPTSLFPPSLPSFLPLLFLSWPWVSDLWSWLPTMFDHPNSRCLMFCPSVWRWQYFTVVGYGTHTQKIKIYSETKMKVSVLSIPWGMSVTV